MNTTSVGLSRRQFGKKIGVAAGTGLMSTAAMSQTAGTPQTLRLQPQDPATEKVVYGISEWFAWYGDYGLSIPPDKLDSVVEDCIDVQKKAGIDRMVWNCGRSTVDYHSDLPNTTRMCEYADTVGDKSWAFVPQVMDRYCPLRRAISYCRKLGMPLLGRLGMNRHYGTDAYAAVTSQFSLKNPRFRERGKDDSVSTGKLCYAFDEVQQERLDILLEIQRIGVDGLVLDFCRQMPVLKYHDALVNPFISRYGADPRRIDSADPADYKQWFQYRADVLSGFMRKVRREVRRQEQTLGRNCPIVARIPDSAPWLMIGWGLDVEQWLKEDLVDATMISPFPRCTEDLHLYPEYHTDLAHKYGKPCIGGVGARELIRGDTMQNTGFFHPKPVYQIASRQYQAGVDAMSLYQTETLARMDYLHETMLSIGDRELVTQRANELPDPDQKLDPRIGLDWHTRLGHGESLRSSAGAYAL